jgi:WD40 repeat protein
MNVLQKNLVNISKKLSIFFMLFISIAGCKTSSIDRTLAPTKTLLSAYTPLIQSTTTIKRAATQSTNSTTPISPPSPHNTKEPTVELTITETPYILSSVGEIRADGKLWIYDGRSIYRIIDMKTGMVTKTSSLPANCFYTPIFESLKVICIGTKNLSLYDLSNHNVQDLSIRNPDRLYLPPWVVNNKYLVYGYWSDDLQKVNIYSYDYATKQEVLISSNNQDSEYYISSDGQQVVTLINNRIYDILTENTIELTPVGYEDLIYDPYSLVWSPVSNLLFFGAGNHNVNPFPETNNYFVVNTDTGVANKFSLPTDELRNSLLGAFWSPDGEQIAIGGGRELCVLNVSELNGECVESIEEQGQYVTAITWSPDSRFIAFYSSDTVYIYDTTNLQHFVLLHDIFTTEIFWR